ncbi:MAG TPA: 16S rRNA (cytosine(1402)-N(4))-methyltransferase, partial [Caulobacter sp.]|nr:16S rRNA (cytosine(1402)-N(4))-methyltransferase [Caulobacter sp.]
MTEAAPHISVLLNEIVDALAPKPGETIIDGTFGAGGYTRAILATGASVVGFDRDPTVLRFTEGLPTDRFRLIQDRFSRMGEHFEPQSV